MTALQAFILGIMVAYTLPALVLALLLWRARPPA
jgi:hypothetical protein